MLLQHPGEASVIQVVHLFPWHPSVLGSDFAIRRLILYGARQHGWELLLASQNISKTNLNFY